jgi:hypothetical protein
MGNPLFGVDISGLINSNIGPGVNDATLISKTPGTRTGGQLTGGTNPTSVSTACKGFIDILDRNRLPGSLVADGDVVIALIGDSISGGAVVPAVGDQITILSKTYEVIQVETDPAQAVYNCTSRSN